MGAEHIGGPIVVIKRVRRGVLDKAGPIDSTEDDVALLIALEGRPSGLHQTQPEHGFSIDDNAIGPYLDGVSGCDRPADDEEVDRGSDQQTKRTGCSARERRGRAEQYPTLERRKR